MRPATPLLVLCLGLPAAAQGLESWNTTEIRVAHFGAAGFTLHTQSRLGAGLHHLGYFRMGPVLTLTQRPWLRWTAGAWHHESWRKTEFREGSSRVYGGPEIRWLNRGVQVWSRHFAEHFWYPEGQAGNRHRHRLQAGWGGRWEPRVSYEGVLDSRGVQLTRPSAGFQVFSGGHASLAVAYLYDFRRESLGGNRHAILTTLRLRFGRER